MGFDLLTLKSAQDYAKKNALSGEAVNNAVNSYLKDNPISAYDDSEIKEKQIELSSQQAIVKIASEDNIESSTLTSGKQYKVGRRIYKFSQGYEPTDAIFKQKVKNGWLYIGDRGGINLSDLGIFNGDDITDILELIAAFVNYTGYTIKIPSGMFKISRPIKFQRAVSIIGAGSPSFITTEYGSYHTILQYVGETSVDAVLNLPTRSLVKDLSITAKNYKLTVDRSKYAGTIADCFTETFGTEINAISCSNQGTFENISIYGFNGYGIYSYYSVYSNVTIWHCKVGIYDKSDAIGSNVFMRYCGIGFEVHGGLLNLSSVRFEDIMSTCITGSCSGATMQGVVDWCGGSILTGTFNYSTINLIGRAACCIGEENNALFKFATGHSGGEFTCTPTFVELDNDKNGKSKVTVPISINTGTAVEMCFKSTTLIPETEVLNLITTSGDNVWARDIMLYDNRNKFFIRGGFNNSHSAQLFVNDVYHGTATAGMMVREGTFCKYGNGSIWGNFGGDLEVVKDTPENESNLIMTTYERITGVINVKLHGLKGDGITDDTEALQKLIGYASEGITKPKILYFPKGTYLITDTIEVRNRLLLKGDWVNGGADNTGVVTNFVINNTSNLYFCPKEANKSMFYAPASSCCEFRVEGLRIQCDSFTIKTTDQVAVAGFPTSYFKDVINLEGINCFDIENITNATFRSCSFVGFSGAAIIVSQHKTIDSCSFKDCYIGVECRSWDNMFRDNWFCHVHYGIQLTAITGYNTNDVFAYNNWFDQITGHAVYATGSATIYLENGIMDMIDYAGIYVNGDLFQSHINTRTSRCGMYYGGTEKEDISFDDMYKSGCIVANGKIYASRIEITPHRREILKGKGIVPAYVIGCRYIGNDNIFVIPIESKYLFWDKNMTYSSGLIDERYDKIHSYTGNNLLSIPNAKWTKNQDTAGMFNDNSDDLGGTVEVINNTFTVNLDCTNNTLSSVRLIPVKNLSLKAGTYTISSQNCNIKSTNVSVYKNYINPQNKLTYFGLLDTLINKRQFTIDEDCEIVLCILFFKSQVIVDGHFNLQIEEGTEVTPWSDPSIDSISYIDSKSHELISELDEKVNIVDNKTIEYMSVKDFNNLKVDKMNDNKIYGLY